MSLKESFSEVSEVDKLLKSHELVAVMVGGKSFYLSEAMYAASAKRKDCDLVVLNSDHEGNAGHLNDYEKLDIFCEDSRRFIQKHK